ncbi:MAG: sigma-70 family RNA polymerase sigma factor, partial [Clostridia bacterium]|nr:sigma-70 family RNA polymerase sigma factor [Clostridia bacterium]
SEKKIKLATYASRCIENEILMFLRKMVKTRNEISLDEPLNVDYEGNKLLLGDVLGTDGGEIYREVENEVEKSILMELFSRLEERDREILCMRYGLNGVEERTQKEIADEMGISQSYISRLEKRILEKLRAEFMKLE